MPVFPARSRSLAVANCRRLDKSDESEGDEIECHDAFMVAAALTTAGVRACSDQHDMEGASS